MLNVKAVKAIANLISQILNPALFAVLTLVVVLLKTNLSLELKLLWFLPGAFLVVIPFFLLYRQHKSGTIVDFWAPSASERQKSLFVWLGAALLLSAAAYFLDAPRLVLAVALVFAVLAFLNLLAGSYFKLSVHSEMVTLFALTVVLTVSVVYIWLLLLIPVVAYSRIVLKAHELSEVTFGVLAALLSLYFVFNLFGLATF